MSNGKYIIDSKNILNPNYELLYIFKSSNENYWQSTAHFHPFTEIFYINSGKGYFNINDKSINLTAGDLLILSPNCLHTENSSFDTSSLEYTIFGINNLILNTVKNDIDSEGFFSLIHYEENNSISHYINELFKEFKEKNTYYEKNIKSLLNLILVSILRNSTNESPSNEVSMDTLSLECLKVKEFIDTNYHKNITLDELAKVAHINKFHLVHSFTKQLGISPINYAIGKRIEESKKLLEKTKYSISRISTDVGFANSSYFSQMFKKLVGCSPNKYRSKTFKN